MQGFNATHEEGSLGSMQHKRLQQRYLLGRLMLHWQGIVRARSARKNIPNEETVPKIRKARGGICAVTMAAQWLLFTSTVFLAVWYGYTQVVNPKAWAYIYQLSTSKAFPTIPAWHMTWYDSYCSWLALVVGGFIIQPWLFAVNSCYHLMSSTKIEQLATIKYNYSLVN